MYKVSLQTVLHVNNDCYQFNCNKDEVDIFIYNARIADIVEIPSSDAILYIKTSQIVSIVITEEPDNN